jgi:hypothetical protein
MLRLGVALPSGVPGILAGTPTAPTSFRCPDTPHSEHLFVLLAFEYPQTAHTQSDGVDDVVMAAALVSLGSTPVEPFGFGMPSVKVIFGDDRMKPV